MVRTKAARAQKVRKGHWLILASSDNRDPWRSRFENDARTKTLGVVKFLEAPIDMYTEYVERRPALYNSFFRAIKKILNSFWDEEKHEGFPPSDWKVVIAFRHGDAQGGVTMHSDANNEDVHWDVAS